MFSVDCNSCQTLHYGPQGIAVSKSVLSLSIVRTLCKAFKKSGLRTEVNNQTLILLAGLCGWNVAEAGHMPAEVAL